MSDLHDNAIEVLLREQFEGPVPEDGFCDRVMQALPPRRRHHAWPLAAGVLAGTVTCWLSLVSAPLLRLGWRDWLAGAVSPPAIILLSTMAGISLLALAWTAAEADDH